MHVEHAGDRGPRLLLVHGSIAPGWGSWEAQRPLATRHRLAVVYRSGYPPNPPLERIDFEVQAGEVADLVEPGMHLVAHSYGGVISLLAAALAGDRLASLTAIEPPAFGVARGNPAVEEFVAGVGALFADRSLDPREFLPRFAAAVGSTANVPGVLPPVFEASVRATMIERLPWEAVIPFAMIRAGGYPVLVVSGGHSAAFNAVCDVLEAKLGAARAIIPGARHSVQRTGAAFNARLTEFIAAAEAGRTS